MHRHSLTRNEIHTPCVPQKKAHTNTESTGAKMPRRSESQNASDVACTASKYTFSATVTPVAR